MTTGERIKYARTAAGLTQKELADKIGVKFAAIHKYESGRVVNLKDETIRALSEALNVKPSWLRCMDDDYVSDMKELLESMKEALDGIEGEEREEQEAQIEFMKDTIADNLIMNNLQFAGEIQGNRIARLSADEQHFLQEFRKLSSEAQENVTRILQIVSTLPEDQQQKVSELVLTVLNTKGLL